MPWKELQELETELRTRGCDVAHFQSASIVTGPTDRRAVVIGKTGNYTITGFVNGEQYVSFQHEDLTDYDERHTAEEYLEALRIAGDYVTK